MSPRASASPLPQGGRAPSGLRQCPWDETGISHWHRLWHEVTDTVRAARSHSDITLACTDFRIITERMNCKGSFPVQSLPFGEGVEHMLVIILSRRAILYIEKVKL